ncbi:peptidoglycan-recognition protein 2-like [Frankliniella occidentalis]|uniref:Peptidoglycan-recognition protein 2-like n=1 Tax=Frankliniella occidentalis TaxID=133901 RepID=A0A6J1T024_FRAOC|nr:peptidoglycan-recognition protein 2-like [Frankliniella occidentalis]
MDLSGPQTVNPDREVAGRNDHLLSLGELASGGQSGTLSLAQSLSYESVSVEGSRNVQIGNNIHIHGEVTLVLPVDSSGLPSAKIRDELGEKPADADKDRPLHSAQDSSKKPVLGARKYRPYFTLAGLAALAVVVVTIVIASLQTGKAEFPGLVTRREWNAWDPRYAKVPDELPLPVRTVIVHHTTTRPCDSRADCAKIVLFIQDLAFDTDNDDIPYNFLVGGDGLVYEGRGWGLIGGAVYGWNSEALVFALVGTFDYVEPTPPQRASLLRLLQWGLDHEKVHAEYRIAGACQLKVNATSTPGLRFMDDLKTWDHWWDFMIRPNRSCTL